MPLRALLPSLDFYYEPTLVAALTLTHFARPSLRLKTLIHISTLRFLFYVLVLLLFDFFPDWIIYKYWTISIKIHHTGYFYYYTTFPIIHTGWKIYLHLQIYVLVDLINLGWNMIKLLLAWGPRYQIRGRQPP